MDNIAQLYNEVISHVTYLFLQKDERTLRKILKIKGKSENGMVTNGSMQESTSDTPNYPKPIGRELKAIIEKLSIKAALVTNPQTTIVDSKIANRKGIKNKLKITKHE